MFTITRYYRGYLGYTEVAILLVISLYLIFHPALCRRHAF